MVRPLFTSALCHEFSLSVNHGLWGFAQVLMFPKLVLRSPPVLAVRRVTWLVLSYGTDYSNGHLVLLSLIYGVQFVGMG